jgi:hypothetical protein
MIILINEKIKLRKINIIIRILSAGVGGGDPTKWKLDERPTPDIMILGSRPECLETSAAGL